MDAMTRRDGGAQAAATRPLSALISAALLLLTVVAGVGGVGGFSGLGKTSVAPVSTVAAASTIGIPVVGDRRAGERRAAPALGTPGHQQHASGWLPHSPELADLPAIAWQPPFGLADSAVEPAPAVIALTIQLSHRGRAPPAGSLLT
jgi:hypothetical protein